MTKQAEGISEKLLTCAKEEFLQKGFADASLRTIAANAGTTTGTIYSRFRDKEGLFEAIVGPSAEHLYNRFLTVQREFHELDPGEQPLQMEDTVLDGMYEMIDYMYDHFEEFQLLLDASHGTRFQNFVEQLVEIETEYTYKYMDAVHVPAQNGETITEEFVHIMNTALFESMFEVIRHKMTREKAKKYVRMLERYHYAGWNTIFFGEQ